MPLTAQETMMLGAEALPGGLADMARTLRTFLESTSAPDERLTEKLEGLRALASRWID